MLSKIVGAYGILFLVLFVVLGPDFAVEFSRNLVGETRFDSPLPGYISRQCVRAWFLLIAAGVCGVAWGKQGN